MFHRAGPSKNSNNARHNHITIIEQGASVSKNEKQKLPAPSYSPNNRTNTQSKRRQCFHRINGIILRLRQCLTSASLCKAIICIMIMISIISLLIPWKRVIQSLILILRQRKQPKQFSNYHFHQPRMVQAFDSEFQMVQGMVPNKIVKRSKHKVKVSSRASKARGSSSMYKGKARDPLYEGDCEPMRWWQEASFPSCNKMHEKHFDWEVAFLTNGGYNSIFRAVDMDESTYILKILQYGTSYSDRNFDRVRRDSLLMERGTASKYIMDIYSYCGFAQIVEYGKHGNLEDLLWKAYDSMTQNDKLHIATQVAQALADVHDLDGDGISSMSHGDFAAKQYILIDGILKLNDFNRGRFIRWNSKLKEPCTYTIGANDGKFRAPEEYQYVPETAAIDIWALGSIFVELVTGYEIWYGYETEDAQQRIAKGKLPRYQKLIGNVTDPINQILIQAVDMCWKYEPKDRPKAGAVADYLKGEAKRVGIDWEKSIFAT